MTAMMSHRNSQSYAAGAFAKKARGAMAPARRQARQLERLVFGLVFVLTAMAGWTAYDAFPQVASLLADPGIAAPALS
ncbi:hypothetical protein [Parvularcula oceani]|uniref:hypothetical protein n=1 Tax=Parvularcula oceani TaxID=1247963 RepID=UPI0004E19DD5|nr:hypothetical protein [Parvularcula oceani]